MRHEPNCPRCGGDLTAPGLWSSAWQCALHGSVAPYHVMQHPGTDAIEHVVGRAGVPVWLALGLPGTWLCGGVGYAGDDRTPARAVATCASGPAPLGGGAELILVAEEPGVGLGSRLAGLHEPDPGVSFEATPPDAHVDAGGHAAAMWNIPSPDDRAIFVGEAGGYWLWAVVHPAVAGVLLYDAPSLVDLRETSAGSQVEFGSVSQRMFGLPLV